MTPIESIYEIQSVVHDPQKYLKDKSLVVYHRARERHEILVDRFFRENKSFVKTERKQFCLDDVACFLKLTDAAIEYYYETGEGI